MIVYALICRSRDAAVLVENYSPELGGNAPQVTVALLERLRDHPEFLPPGERKIFAQRNDTNDFFSDILMACTGGFDTADGGLMDHFFHVWHVGGVFYSCLSDDPDVRSHQVNFAFLEHVKTEFTSLYKERRIEKANAYGLDKDFGPHLRSAMHFYNSNGERLRREAKVEDLVKQIESMKTVMGRNIHLALERGENLESLVEKSDKMQKDSLVFKKRGNQLMKIMKLQNMKYSCFLGGLGICLVWFFVSCLCGFNLSRCIGDEESDEESD